MKNLVLALELVLILFSDLVTALTGNLRTNLQERIPVTIFTIEIQPPIRVLQIPSEKRIRFGDIIGEEIGFSRYRGIVLNKPICVRYDMTIQQIADALCDSFNVDRVRCCEGVITRRHFERIFPPFSFFYH